MDKLNPLYEKFDDMYKKLKKMKEHFDTIKQISEQTDKQVEQMRQRHEEQTRIIFEAIEKRDEEIRKYLERTEQDRIHHLLADMGNLLDEMFDIRLKLLEEREGPSEGEKS